MKNKNQKQGDLGQHWTPVEIVDLMYGLLSNTKDSILEPTAGSGRFVRKTLSCNRLVKAIEIDQSVIPKDISAHYEVADFFDWKGGTYKSIIGNPPYVNGRLLSNSKWNSWGGALPATANMYLHVIEKCVKMHMESQSEIVLIVPDSLLSGTSMGRSLRQWMHENGAFTHYLTPRVMWEKAAVGTCIFRWVKHQKQGSVLTSHGNMHLICNQGMIKLIDYASTSTLGDFFHIGVGAAPKKEFERTDGGGSSFIKSGQLRNFDTTNFSTWPRARLTEKRHKIFVMPGPTRRIDVCYSSFSWDVEQASRHLDHFLLPKKNIKEEDLEKLAAEMNDWLQQRCVMLHLRSDGRWSVGVSELKSLPLDQNLQERLKFYGL